MVPTLTSGTAGSVATAARAHLPPRRTSSDSSHRRRRIPWSSGCETVDVNALTPLAALQLLAELAERARDA